MELMRSKDQDHLLVHLWTACAFYGPFRYHFVNNNFLPNLLEPDKYMTFLPGTNNSMI